MDIYNLARCSIHNEHPTQKKIEVCFLLSWETKQLPRKKDPQLVIFHHQHYKPNIHLYKLWE